VYVCVCVCVFECGNVCSSFVLFLRERASRTTQVCVRVRVYVNMYVCVRVCNSLFLCALYLIERSACTTWECMCVFVYVCIVCMCVFCACNFCACVSSRTHVYAYICTAQVDGGVDIGMGVCGRLVGSCVCACATAFACACVCACACAFACAVCVRARMRMYVCVCICVCVRGFRSTLRFCGWLCVSCVYVCVQVLCT